MVSADKGKSDTKDPFITQRKSALEGLTSATGWGPNWAESGTPKIPTWMQGPASTIDPLTKMLTESINTGMPTNVSAIAKTSRDKAMRDFEQDLIPQILEKFGMGGQRFGSDTAGMITRTSGDILTNLAVNEANLGYGAAEAAAGRRIQAGGMAGLPMELQKYAMLLPELLSFIMGVTPTSEERKDQAAIFSFSGGG